MQDKNIKSLPIFPELATALQELSHEDIGKFMSSYFNYGFKGEKPDFKENTTLRCLWSIAQPQLDRANENYKEKCLRNAYNRYLGECKKANNEPLSQEKWQAERERAGNKKVLNPFDEW